MSRTAFVSYASGGYRKNIKSNVWFAKKFIRPDEIYIFEDSDLKNDEIYDQHRHIFDVPKGGGYWAWKPWAILRAVESMAEGDVVIYQDCGHGLKYKSFCRPEKLIELCRREGCIPGVSIPHQGPNKKWTHRRCFRAMDCDSPYYWDSPQIEASISLWTVNKQSKDFLKEWLFFCLKEDAVADICANDIEKIAEFSEYVDHRSDQSILSNLVLKRSLRPLVLPLSDEHFSKSLSIAELSLRNGDASWGLVLKIILFLMRTRRGLVKWAV